MPSATLHPLVQWAQRESCLYLTIEVDKIAELTVGNKVLHVKGTYGGSAAEYEATIEFYADVKEDYRRIDNNRHLELVLNKEAAGWWPRLLKQQGKVPWVKVDFNKWKDQDDDEDELGGMSEGFDFNNYMANMGGTGGDSGAPNLDDFDDEDASDAEDMPDLEDATGDEAKTKKEEDKPKTANGASGDQGDKGEETPKP